MLRKLLTFVFIMPFVLINNGIGQDYLLKADKQFNLHAFDLAIYHYGLHLKTDPTDAEAMKKLAEAHFYTNQNSEAILWLKKADDLAALNAEHLILLGKAYKKVADYNSATKVFSRLMEMDESRGRYWLTGCDIARGLLANEESYEISPFGGNSPFSDFGPVAFKDKWIFSSFRDDIKSINQKMEVIPGSKLLYTDHISPKYRNILPLRSAMKENYKLGPISYSDDYKMCAVSFNNFRDNYIPGYDQENENYIMIADALENGDFENEKNFPHNMTGYSSTYPFLTKNSTVLYFSSNRPGGYGGYDLYVSEFKSGEWTEPVNLGPEINTPGNEITPFVRKDRLFFSSDYHHGVGGYDIFVTEYKSDQWARPVNMGNGINSPGDDVFPFMTVDNDETFYFSSNRIGGMGNLDIYKGVKALDRDIVFQYIDFIPLDDTGKGIDKVEEEPQMIVVNQGQEKEEWLKEIEDELITLSEIANQDEELDETIIPQPYVMDNPQEERAKPMIMDLEAARMVSLNEPVQNGAMVYFVQLAAFSKSVDNANKFKNLAKYGNLYQVSESNMVKLRLGYYFDENHAREVLKTVKNQGFQDAFVTKEQLNTSKMELLFSNLDFDSPSSYMTESLFKGKSQYKVRLASYEDPLWFDISNAKDIGRVEQWTKGGWTIFICSGYHSLEEAEKAKIKAINKGFRDAQVVFDNEGILENVKRN